MKKISRPDFIIGKLNRLKSNRSGAVELSFTTIVILVLAMTMLILGLVLVKNIFSGATDIASMTTDQLKSQVSKLFGEDNKVVIYPDSRIINVKVGGKPSGFGIGIKNLLESASNVKFSYEVVVSDSNLESKCGVRNDVAQSWLTTGAKETDIPISPGELMATKVLVKVPAGTELCTFRYRINNQNYGTDIIDVTLTG
jgi:hypothetical protein